jgi:hypothetical protein
VLTGDEDEGLKNPLGKVSLKAEVEEVEGNGITASLKPSFFF